MLQNVDFDELKRLSTVEQKTNYLKDIFKVAKNDKNAILLGMYSKPSRNAIGILIDTMWQHRQMLGKYNELHQSSLL